MDLRLNDEVRALCQRRGGDAPAVEQGFGPPPGVAQRECGTPGHKTPDDPAIRRDGRRRRGRRRPLHDTDLVALGAERLDELTSAHHVAPAAPKRLARHRDAPGDSHSCPRGAAFHAAAPAGPASDGEAPVGAVAGVSRRSRSTAVSPTAAGFFPTMATLPQNFCKPGKTVSSRRSRPYSRNRHALVTE